jgi:preprotein translocase subunit SecA
MASITYQNYFKFYDKLAGMTGTAETSKEEFQKVYSLDVLAIPTNKPIRRIDHNDVIFQTEQGKFKAIAIKIKELHQKGQPVLIGTVSVEKNELLSAYLDSQGVPHQILNAKKHEQEGAIVAQAGRKGSVTIATNMAGRGVDIKLGGNPFTEEAEEEIKNLGGLFVIGTERHDARRIDNQLRGRCGRQGDPGETQFYISLDDPVARIFGGDRLTNLIGRMGIPEDEPILPAGRMGKIVASRVEKAQQMVEGHNFDARKHVLSYDDVLSTHRNSVYSRRHKLLLDQGEEVREMYENIVTDVPEEGEADVKLIKEKRDQVGDEVFFQVLSQIALRVTDELWMQHLEIMNNARQSVNLRAYGQREPLVEYKKEGLRLFRELEVNFTNSLRRFMANANIEQRASGEPAPQVIEVDPEIAKSHGRNDRITIQKGEEKQEIKFKKYDQYAKDGWRIV